MYCLNKKIHTLFIELLIAKVSVDTLFVKKVLTDDLFILSLNIFRQCLTVALHT